MPLTACPSRNSLRLALAPPWPEPSLPMKLGSRPQTDTWSGLLSGCEEHTATPLRGCHWDSGSAGNERIERLQRDLDGHVAVGQHHWPSRIRGGKTTLAKPRAARGSRPNCRWHPRKGERNRPLQPPRIRLTRGVLHEHDKARPERPHRHKPLRRPIHNLPVAQIPPPTQRHRPRPNPAQRQRNSIQMPLIVGPENRPLRPNLLIPSTARTVTLPWPHSNCDGHTPQRIATHARHGRSFRSMTTS